MSDRRDKEKVEPEVVEEELPYNEVRDYSYDIIPNGTDTTAPEAEPKE